MDITLASPATRPGPSSHRQLTTYSIRRPRIQTAVVFAAVGVLLLLGLWINHAKAQQKDQPLVPHRATYDMKLAVARPNSGIVEVGGRMVLETVEACEGWEVKQRIKLTFLRNDGDEFTTGGEEFEVTASDFTRPQRGMVQVTRTRQGAT